MLLLITLIWLFLLKKIVLILLEYKPQIDVRKNGITLRQLEPYCRKYRIKVKVYDVDETLLYDFKPEKADHHKTTLMFIIHDGHPYSIIDKVRRLQLSSKNRMF